MWKRRIFYIRQKFSGIAESIVDKNGDLTFDNARALDDATYKLISKYYFCESVIVKQRKYQKTNNIKIDNTN